MLHPSPQLVYQDEHHIDEADNEFALSTLKVQKGDDLEHKILDLERRLIKIQVGSRSQNKDSFNFRSLFSHEILSEPILNWFKMLAIESFDGSSDLMDHIEGNRIFMALQGAYDALLCIVFPTTLKKKAKVWFFGLP